MSANQTYEYWWIQQELFSELAFLAPGKHFTGIQAHETAF